MTHVLIADDLQESRYLLQALLEGHGYWVTAVRDGLEALAAARREPPDVIVSDALMPKMDGFTLCRAWMQDASLRTIPFIFYSATYTNSEDEKFALALGAVRYLIKPQETEAFLGELRAVLRDWATRPATGSLLDEEAFFALHDAALSRKLEHKIAQLKATIMSIVKMAMALSEMRDPYTAGHERRVAEIAVAIGAELGFDADRQEGLRAAGYLHDVGKIAIPTEILSKPGKLSSTEFLLIKQHPRDGFEVLKSVEFPWPVAQVALQHHERMDGSGYPHGLQGDAILFEARIMAVADVIEAMASHRPYRAGLGIDKALAEIERGRGSLYDAAVADACLKLFREKGYRGVDTLKE